MHCPATSMSMTIKLSVWWCRSSNPVYLLRCKIRVRRSLRRFLLRGQCSTCEFQTSQWRSSMTELSEMDFLRNAVSELEEEGYEVFVQPQSPILPSFLKDFRPDAIARRNGKNLVIEVVKTLEGRDKALAAMASSIRAHPGWEMRVIVVN